ncbi:hypothetical protein BHE74_00002545 [Ensete ventricosum]|nr:hypothetical protein GW17_00044459 [Ensete ventricosum]RWW88575.1 hypothetical protein BHE74_00002545 [Ensete ventricosum]
MPSRSRNGDVIDEAFAPVRESQSTRGQESSVRSELRQCLSVDDRNGHARAGVTCRIVVEDVDASPLDAQLTQMHLPLAGASTNWKEEPM